MILIGHRGAAICAPENTLRSFEMAIEMGCKGIELDVQMTKDGEFVVIHDYSVDRTTNGSGYVSELTYKEIRQLDAGSWFGLEFAGQKIPSLEEVLTIMPPDALVNIELKKELHEENHMEEKLVHLLRRSNAIENVVVSSFDHMSIKKVKEIDPEVKTGLLLYSNLIDVFAYLEQNQLEVYSIHQTEEFITNKFVQEAHNKGYKVYAYTVNAARAFKKCIDVNVDGVITDDPHIAQRFGQKASLK
ncbi:glycerophosphodiester phosphodiesterase [Caldalkalibacillus mannanilyticus]|uniref:glycerophosphodiester phosphodiesterase n=1 Tax=Caldalkalibacillus mannanilyticus TaxID=1418 RepID=UPI00046858C6|nr:glycerophosphodiester phosphodiesterase [Caldalkalibacillus mannanilyticus]